MRGDTISRTELARMFNVTPYMVMYAMRKHGIAGEVRLRRDKLTVRVYPRAAALEAMQRSASDARGLRGET